MTLNFIEWGSGDRTALLLHGMGASAESWWRAGPAIADRGYRVIALDLPGHGRSPRDPSASNDSVATAVIDFWKSVSVHPPAVAIGHSFGGAILAVARARFRAERTVFVDSPFVARGGWDYEETRREYSAHRTMTTLESLRRDRPFWSEHDREIEVRASELFDPATAASIAAGPPGSWLPEGGDALVIRANPSEYVSDERAAELGSRGVIVRDIAGAAHSVWYTHFDEFMTALDGWV